MANGGLFVEARSITPARRHPDHYIADHCRQEDVATLHALDLRALAASEDFPLRRMVDMRFYRLLANSSKTPLGRG